MARKGNDSAAVPSSLGMAALALITILGACVDETIPPALNAVYTNETHGFTLHYPDTLDLREYTDEDAAIGYAAGDGMDVRVEISVESGQAESFESFVEERALLACFADAPGISLYCPSLERRDRVRTISGLRGDVLYLRHERATVGGGPPVEIGERGPFVAFDITDRAADEGFRVLFVRAPVSLERYLLDADLVLEVARTLQPLQ